MFKKTCTAIGIGLFSLATALPIAAQETATLALKNGERPSGELVDMGAGGFILRINGQDRQFPTGAVAAVEFVVGPLPSAAQQEVNQGRPIVLLRNGQVIEGRLVDVGGTHPLRLTVETAGGTRDFNSNEVAQLHLAPLNNPGTVVTRGGGQPQAPAPAPAPVPAGAINVPANQGWTNTGIPVLRGERVSFSARGDIMISPTASTGPNGSPAVTSRNVRYPLQNAYAGALIGRVGNSAPFLIGTNTQPIVMPTNGPLMLGINDDVMTDNSGSYAVNISREGDNNNNNNNRRGGNRAVPRR
jgi:PA-IL-like protein